MINRKNLNRNKKYYEKNGYAVYKKTIDVDTIKKIKLDLDKFLKVSLKKFKKHEVHLSKDKSVNSLHNLKKWKWISKIQKEQNIKKIVDSILGIKPRKFGAELFAKPAKTGRDVPIHQDNYYWCTESGKGITIWISLGKSNKKNGAVFYFLGSHKMGLLEHKISYKPGSSQVLKNLDSLKFFKKITPNLNPGDCIVHNSLVVHGSNKNLSKASRMGITLRYLPREEVFDLDRRKIYQKELKKSLKGLKNARV